MILFFINIMTYYSFFTHSILIKKLYINIYTIMAIEINFFQAI